MNNQQSSVNWRELLFDIDNKTGQLPLEVGLVTAFRVYFLRFLAMLLVSIPSLIFIGYAWVFIEKSAIISLVMIVLSSVISLLIFTASIRRKPTVFDKSIKRLIDIFICVIAIVLLAPLIILVAGAVKIESMGPVFVKQKRLGKNDREFWVMKFRTTIMGADDESILTGQGLEWSSVESPDYSRSEPRITKIGRVLRRTNLDELPQMWSVLKGEMSLVGPRPITANLAEQLRDDKYYKIRQSVTPGITGLWQVVLFASHDFDHSTMLKLDAYYAEHWNLWMDIQILARTMIAVFDEVQGAY